MENPVLGKQNLLRTEQKHPLWGRNPRELKGVAGLGAGPRGGGALWGVSLLLSHALALVIDCMLKTCNLAEARATWTLALKIPSDSWG